MIEKSIPTDLTAARHLTEEILGRVEGVGYSEDDRFAIRLALEEALINAIKHGNKFDHARKVTVSADVGQDQTTITVCDDGAGFDPDAVPDPTTDENLEKPSGRGIMLMKAYMDEVSYNDRGNEVRMAKRRCSGLPHATGRH
ncbi:MAG: ATP-binding protein [Planctomycetota bacterium]|nr:ATP-binding protein [Planctomycetota bacterium]